MRTSAKDLLDVFIRGGERVLAIAGGEFFRAGAVRGTGVVNGEHVSSSRTVINIDVIIV